MERERERDEERERERDGERVSIVINTFKYKKVWEEINVLQNLISSRFTKLRDVNMYCRYVNVILLVINESSRVSCFIVFRKMKCLLETNVVKKWMLFSLYLFTWRYYVVVSWKRVWVFFHGICYVVFSWRLLCCCFMEYVM